MEHKTHAQQQAAHFKANTDWLAKVYNVPVGTIAQWRFERAEAFLTDQFTHYDADLFTEVFTSAEFWQWFTHQWNLIDSRFLALHGDLVEMVDAGIPTGRKVFKAAYNAAVDYWLESDTMQRGYAQFIKQYVKLLQPVPVTNKPTA